MLSKERFLLVLKNSLELYEYSNSRKTKEISHHFIRKPWSEAYAGAALQHQFMDKTLYKIDANQIGYLIIHALNPWGFKYLRRGTENNVN